jgi:predicted nucleic acid-binding Zn finger protein
MALTMAIIRAEGSHSLHNTTNLQERRGTMTVTSSTPQVSPVAQIEALYESLSKAKILVADNKVHPIYGMINYYVVDGSNTHYLVKGSCNCPDATNRVELTKGLCKHRLAAMVYAEQQAKAETPDKEELERKISELYK